DQFHRALNVRKQDSDALPLALELVFRGQNSLRQMLWRIASRRQEPGSPAVAAGSNEAAAFRTKFCRERCLSATFRACAGQRRRAFLAEFRVPAIVMPAGRTPHGVSPN